MREELAKLDVRVDEIQAGIVAHPQVLEVVLKDDTMILKQINTGNAGIEDGPELKGNNH